MKRRVLGTSLMTVGLLLIIGLNWQNMVVKVLALAESQKVFPTDFLFNSTGYSDGNGLISVGSSEVTLAREPTWWNVSYKFKRQITLKNLSSSTAPVTTTGQYVVDLNILGLGTTKLQASLNDLRVVYSVGTSHTEINRTVTRTVGATNVATISFPLQASIGSTASDNNYYIYYGNVGASNPTLANGFSLNTKTATLICLFMATTTCEGGQTPTTETGAIRYFGNSAMQFNGKSNYIVTGASSDFSGWNKFTVEYWSNKAGLAGTFSPLARWTGSNQILFYETNNKIYTYINGTIYGYTTSNPLTSSWNHVAVVYDGDGATNDDRLKTYVNGVQQTLAFTGTIPSTMPVANIPYYVGSYNATGGASYNGKIDEIRVSNIVRYSANFTPQTTPFEPDGNTKLLFHFDENGDDPRLTGKVFDASGNGNNGTITGAKYVNDSPIKASSFASHSGILIEEATTNLFNNPSFENATFNLGWTNPYFNFSAVGSSFTPAMAKRNSAGPFAAGVMSQGKYDGTGNGDYLLNSIGSQINGAFYQNYDSNQGSIVLWVTPEWNGNDGQTHYLVSGNHAGEMFLYKSASSTLVLSSADLHFNMSVGVSDWTAGTTYNIVARWDTKNKIDGTNFASLSINGITTYGSNTTPAVVAAGGNTIIGASNQNTGSANAIIEGLTIYRRVLFDGAYGTDVGNGDEINKIYNSGTGKDPTLVTGSWDVVFALPTNGSTGSLGTGGTGNAWSMPHSSNLLGVGGFMMGTGVSADGWNGLLFNKLNNVSLDSDLTGWSGTQSYSLDDEFGTSLPAGSVNGSTATDGVNARQVIDTANYLSVGNGTLNIVGSTASANPGIWYPGFSRNVGSVFVTDFNNTFSSGQDFYIGFNTTRGAVGAAHALYLRGSTGIYLVSGTKIGNAYTSGVTYKAALVMRSNGAYYYIKGGTEYPNWTLLYIDSTNNGTPLYPQLTFSNVQSVTADSVRIPTSTFLPNPLVYDTFSSGTTATETTGPDGQSAPSLVWNNANKSGGTMSVVPTEGSDVLSGWDFTNGWLGLGASITSNNSWYSSLTSDAVYKTSLLTNGQFYRFTIGSTRTGGNFYSGNNTPSSGIPTLMLTNSSDLTFRSTNVNFGFSLSSSYSVSISSMTLKPLTISSLFSTVGTTTSDVIMDVGISMTTGTQAGLVLGLDNNTSPSNFILVYHNGTNLIVDEAVNGVYTNKQSTAVALGAGQLRAIKDGTKLRVYLNNALVGSELTMTANTNTRHGIFSTYAGNTFDNFSIFARGTGGEYAGIPAEDLTASYSTAHKYAGAGAALLVAAGNDANFVQTANVGDTQTYTLTAYAYTTGSAVTSSDLNLFYDAGTIPTTFSSTGVSGWYMLSGDLTGANANKSFGVRVKAGKTVYVDQFNLAVKTNKFTNALFDNNVAGWSGTQSYSLDDEFSDTGPTTLLSGGVSSPVPVVGSELVTNGGAENGDPPTGWTTYSNPTISRSTEQVHNGIYSTKVVGGTGENGARPPVISVTSGKWYALEGYVYVDTNTGFSIYGADMSSGRIINLVTGWNKLYDVNRSTASSSSELITVRNRSGTSTNYVDDVSVKELTLPSLFSNVSEATTNKIVSVGITLTVGTQAGIVLNLDNNTSPQNFVIAYHDGTNVHLEKDVGGTYTSLINTAATYVAGATLKVLKVGTSYTVVYNNVSLSVV